MIFKIVFIVFLLFSNLFAHCFYLDCTSGVASATASVNLKLNSKFNDIEQNMDKIKDLYAKKENALKENNLLYKKIILLKKEYLLNLKEINFELNKQKEIK